MRERLWLSWLVSETVVPITALVALLMSVSAFFYSRRSTIAPEMSATVDTGKVTTSHVAVAKHYGVQVKPCPPRCGNLRPVPAAVFWVSTRKVFCNDNAQSDLGRML